MLSNDRTIVPHVIDPQELVTFSGEATVREAATLMDRRRVGAVLVVEGGRLIGIFTERDAITRVVAAGRDPDRTRLREVMTADPDTVSADDPASHALRMMSDRGYRHLPVVAGERLVGIVSVRDLYRSVKDQMETNILLLAESLIQG
ncbi:MAG: CBS domain-containing protein [Pseudomonadota bacterium]